MGIDREEPHCFGDCPECGLHLSETEQAKTLEQRLEDAGAVKVAAGGGGYWPDDNGDCWLLPVPKEG